MRLFVAVNPGEPLRDAVTPWLDDLRVRWDLKWVEPRNLHVTLRFLGEMSEDRLPALREALPAAARRRHAFTVRPAGVGAFPNFGRPRVLFLQLDDGGRLSDLAASVEIELARRLPGELAEPGPFRPHLTLGRVRRGDARRRPAGPNDLAAPDLPEFTVGSIELFASRLTPQGPIYRSQGVFPLAAPR